MIDGFCALLAKRAKPTVGPTAFSETVRHPNPILVSQPCEKLHLQTRDGHSTGKTRESKLMPLPLSTTSASCHH
jgi:hypothetical protein